MKDSPSLCWIRKAAFCILTANFLFCGNFTLYAQGPSVDVQDPPGIPEGRAMLDLNTAVGVRLLP